MKKLLLPLLLLLATAFGSLAQAPCVASFTTSPITIGNSLLGVHITNTSTYGTLGANQYVSMMAHYGIGPWVPVQVNSFYNAPGVYTIKLAVRKYDSLTNATICTDTMTQTFNATWPPCGATITATSGSNGLYTFTATNPAGSTGIIYYWNFGDGTGASGSTASHNYANGTYACSLISLLPSGCSDTNTISITVANFSINCASLTSSFTSYTLNGVVYFNAYATNVSGYTKVYDWDFGNGNYFLGTPTTTSRTYTPGTYTVALRTLWKNSANVTICSDTVMQTITILPCAATPASFTSTGSGPGAIVFTNTSSAATTYSPSYHWSFGDGGFASTTNASHVYTSTGTYNVMLVRSLIDSLSGTNCRDTGYGSVVITSVPPPPPPPNVISGNVYFDSSANLSMDPFIVYLVKFNAATNILTAVDSTTIPGYWGTPYSFGNKAAGTYLVKASLQTNVASTNGLIPTYHDSSLYWYAAQSITHTGVTSSGNNVYMRRGSTTAGPGFVGGNVSLGANKGTAAGVPNIPVFLRNTSGKVIASTYTNTNGDYSFSNIPVGNYTLYPENMNYATTAFSIAITAAQPTVNAINFNQDNAQMNIKPRTTGINNLASSNTEFSIYPNPAKNTLKVVTENVIDKTVDLIITDITGQLVRTQQLILSGDNVHSIDVSNLQSGFYFVRLKSEHMDQVQKVAIQH